MTVYSFDCNVLSGGEAYLILIFGTGSFVNILGGYAGNAKNIDKKLAYRLNIAILRYIDNLSEQR
jgi:hypothetical protein